MTVILVTSCWSCGEDAPYARVAKLGRCYARGASGRASCVIVGLSAKRKCRAPYPKKQEKVPLRVHRMLFLPSAGFLSVCHSVFYLLFNVFLSKEKLNC